MDCPTCVAHVEDALRKHSEVRSVDVNLFERTVRIGGPALDGDTLAEALRRAGYPPEIAEQSARPPEPEPLFRLPGARGIFVAAILWLAGLAIVVLPGDPVFAEVWRWRIGPAEILFLASAIIAGSKFIPAGLRGIRAFRLDIAALMTIAIAGAAILGDFSESAAIGVLFSLAELLERRSTTRARDAIRGLVALAPPRARVVRSGIERTMPVDAVLVGERIAVRPGERIALDGTVVSGESDVNEASITGEPLPVRRGPGDAVLAGTLAVDGYLEIAVERAASDTVIAHVAKLVQAASERKARVEYFVEKFARIYTPAVVGLALILAVVPPLAFDGDWGTWVLRGLTLLVVSCPCALVISTPVSVVSAITSAARHGIVIAGGEHLEALGGVRAIAFDKTGTITTGVPTVAGLFPRKGLDEENLLRVAAAIECHSAHPLARAMVAEADARGIPYDDADVTGVTEIPGHGIAATLFGVPHRIVAATIAAPPGMEVGRMNGQTLVQVERDGVTLGYIALSDAIRTEAAGVVGDLRSAGFTRIALVTGDHRTVAESVAREVGIAESDVHAGCLPADKLAEIRRMDQESGGVAMVGDGVNDAPALAAATVGIAMGAAGSPTALDAADIALMADDLRMLPFLVRLSRMTRRIIRQNIAVSIAIKVIMIVGVPFGLVSMTLAVLVGDMGTSLAVTTNALRLARAKPKE